MLKVKTYIKHSKGRGIGLFALNFIPKDTIIWKFEFPDIKFKYKELAFLDTEILEYSLKYGWLQDRTFYLCGDDAKFMNHSKNPNCHDTKKFTISKRDIQKDEEITCNYFEFDDLTKKYGLGFKPV